MKAAMAAAGLGVDDLVARKVLSRAGVYQWLGDTVKREKVRDETVKKLCKALGVSREWLLDGRGGMRGTTAATPSQPAGLDLARLGVALTAMDKALDDRVIQGRLGTLAEALQFAYQRAVKMNDPADPHQRELFDDVVREHLRGWNGREGIAEPSAVEDRQVAAKAEGSGGGARRRRR